MSTNIRNEQRAGFMRNFSTYVIDRYIIIDDETLTDNEKDKFVSDINEALWLAIQETNILAENRILPYVRIRRGETIENNQLRIIINDIDSENSYSDYENTDANKIDIKQLSHLINFKTLSPRKQIQVSDRLIPGNAKMIINHSDQISAAVDIFLDISMFNSIAFFNKMTHEDKFNFSNKKFQFSQDSKLSSYYMCSKENPPAYWSFAFSTRTDNKSIDYYKYVSLWNEFLKKNYPNIRKNDMLVMPPHEQIKLHRDIDNLDTKYLSKEYWDTQQPGEWLLIRINREPNDNERKIALSNMFGISSFHIGAVKLVPINYYHLPFMQQQLKELYISAYKIVV